MLGLRPSPAVLRLSSLHRPLAPLNVARLASTGTGTTTNHGQPRKNPYQAWWAIEAIPIYVIIGGAVVGATWYLVRLARGPDVIWSKSNPTPWNTVEQDQTTKMFHGHHKHEKSWSR